MPSAVRANPYCLGDRVEFRNGNWSPADMIVVDVEGVFVTVAYRNSRLASKPRGRVVEEHMLFVHLVPKRG